MNRYSEPHRKQYEIPAYKSTPSSYNYVYVDDNNNPVSQPFSPSPPQLSSAAAATALRSASAMSNRESEQRYSGRPQSALLVRSQSSKAGPGRPQSSIGFNRPNSRIDENDPNVTVTRSGSFIIVRTNNNDNSRPSSRQQPKRPPSVRSNRRHAYAPSNVSLDSELNSISEISSVKFDSVEQRSSVIHNPPSGNLPPVKSALRDPSRSRSSSLSETRGRSASIQNEPSLHVVNGGIRPSTSMSSIGHTKKTTATSSSVKVVRASHNAGDHRAASSSASRASSSAVQRSVSQNDFRSSYRRSKQYMPPIYPDDGLSEPRAPPPRHYVVDYIEQPPDRSGAAAAASRSMHNQAVLNRKTSGSGKTLQHGQSQSSISKSASMNAISASRPTKKPSTTGHIPTATAAANLASKNTSIARPINDTNSESGNSVYMDAPEDPEVARSKSIKKKKSKNSGSSTPASGEQLRPKQTRVSFNSEHAVINPPPDTPPLEPLKSPAQRKSGFGDDDSAKSSPSNRMLKAAARAFPFSMKFGGGKQQQQQQQPQVNEQEPYVTYDRSSPVEREHPTALIKDQAQPAGYLEDAAEPAGLITDGHLADAQGSDRDEEYVYDKHDAEAPVPSRSLNESERELYHVPVGAQSGVTTSTRIPIGEESDSDYGDNDATGQHQRVSEDQSSVVSSPIDAYGGAKPSTQAQFQPRQSVRRASYHDLGYQQQQQQRAQQQHQLTPTASLSRRSLRDERFQQPRNSQQQQTESIPIPVGLVRSNSSSSFKRKKSLKQSASLGFGKGTMRSERDSAVDGTNTYQGPAGSVSSGLASRKLRPESRIDTRQSNFSSAAGSPSSPSSNGLLFNNRSGDMQRPMSRMGNRSPETGRRFSLRGNTKKDGFKSRFADSDSDSEHQHHKLVPPLPSINLRGNEDYGDGNRRMSAFQQHMENRRRKKEAKEQRRHEYDTEHNASFTPMQQSSQQRPARLVDQKIQADHGIQQQRHEHRDQLQQQAQLQAQQQIEQIKKQAQSALDQASLQQQQKVQREPATPTAAAPTSGRATNGAMVAPTTEQVNGALSNGTNGTVSAPASPQVKKNKFGGRFKKMFKLNKKATPQHA